MEEAERIAQCEHRSKKIAVISGVGTRHYYRKLGYHLEGPYMVKAIGQNPGELSVHRNTNANQKSSPSCL